MGERVVVTGIGPVTPVGTGVGDFWAGITSGRNGIRRITAFETDDLPVKVAGEVPGFDPSPWLDPKEIRRTDPSSTTASRRPPSRGRTRASPRCRPSARA
jgi:3-oxoacyl-[acyl-carrier-protein] synthase II